RHCLLVGDKEERIPVSEPGRSAQSRNLARIEIARDRSLGAAFGKDEVAEARGALLPRPVVELVEETPRPACCSRCGNRSHNSAGSDGTREERKTAVAEDFGHIGDEQRIAQIWLIRTVLQHRLIIRYVWKRHRADRAITLEFLEHAVQHGPDG